MIYYIKGKVGNKMNFLKKFALTFFVLNIIISVAYLNNFESRADLLSDMEDQAEAFMKKGETEASDLGDVVNSVTGEFKGLGQILTMIGAGVMVAVTSYMGIMYLISPPDKQAALKQQLIGLVAAGIVIFGAYGIWQAILKVVENF